MEHNNTTRRIIRWLLLPALVLLSYTGSAQTTLAQWDFNDNDVNADVGSGTLSTIGGVTAGFLNATAGSVTCCSSTSSDPGGTNRAWELAGFPGNGTGNGTAGVEFAVSTVGYTGIKVKWDQRQGQTGSRYFQLSYSINGSTFITTGLPAPLGPGTEGILDLYPSTGGTNPGFDNGIEFDLTGLLNVHGNSNFKVRITAVFQPPGTTYLAARHLSTYTTAGTARFDMITVTGLVDTDGDSVADATDNCPTTPNTDQADVDSDGDGNSCDNCLFAVNSGQEDADTDGLGDVCDNCPNDANGAQDDGDNDNVGDACDACPTNGNLPVGPNGCPTSIYVNDGNTGDDVVTTAAGNDGTGDGTSAAPFATIMHAMGLVPDGGTIIVDGGTYTEQVVTGGKNVTITGQGRSGATMTRILAPATLTNYVTNGGDHYPIVYASGLGKTFNLNNVLVDGDNGRDLDYYGIYFYEASGSVNFCRVTDIHDAGVVNGMQRGVGIMANHIFDASVTQSVTIDNNIIDNYQKGGVVLNELNTEGVVTNNQVTWSGGPNVNGANGIQFGWGSWGTITGNTVAGNVWNEPAPHTWVAGGIILVGVGVDYTNTPTGTTTTVSGNTLNGNESGILVDEGGYGYDSNAGLVEGPNTYSGNWINVWLEAPATVPNGSNTYDKRVDNASLTNVVYGSIQYAVDFGSTGDVLTASAGTFTENVTVDKTNMSLNGAQAGNARCTPATESTIDGGTGTAVTIAADGVVLNGFHLDAKTGVSSTGFSGGTFQYNLVDADLYGIAAQGMTNGHTVSSNCVDLSQQFDGPTPTAGIALVGATGTAPVVQNNTVKDGYYGYVLYGMLNPTTVSGGTVSGTQLGVAVSNSTATVAPWGTLLPSNVTVNGVSMSGFTGAVGAQVGVYTFTAPGTVPAQGLNVSVTGCTIDGTGKPVQNSAAIGFEDYSGGSVAVQTVSVSGSTLTNNRNRGINVRGMVTADIDGSVLTNNGYDAFGSGDNDGFGVLVSENAGATVNNCIINNPTSATPYAVHALALGNGSTNSLVATDNSIGVHYAEANSFGATNNGTGTLTAECNYWAETAYQDILPRINGTVDFINWRQAGTDDGNPANGYQPQSPADDCTGNPITDLAASETAPGSCASTADGAALATLTTGVAPYIFSWVRTAPSAYTSPTTTATPADLYPGTYDVTVTDALGTTATISGVVITVAPYSGPTWYVSTTGSDSNTGSAGCPFATIQFAVNSASNGHAVNVAVGTYIENVLVDKSLDIGGSVGTTVYPALVGNVCGGGSLCVGASSVFLVRADNVTIHDLTVDGDNTGIGSGIDARNGIIVDHNSGTFTNLEVHDVTVQNIWLRAIQQGSGGTFNFHDNTVSNVQSDPSSIGVFGFGGHGSIQNNNVSGCNDAIAVNQGIGGNLEISDNTVTNSGSGVHVDNWNGGGTVTIHDNTVSGGTASAYGIWAFAAYAPITIADNMVSGQYVGLMHAGSSAAAGVVTFSGNEVSDCDYGLYQTTTLFGYGDVNVESVAMNNIIADGGTAFELESTASGVTRTFTAHENSVTGYTTATHVTVNGPATDDMTCNWWDTGDALAVDAAVDDGIVFLPFDNNGVDNAPATKGYQPTPTACGGVGPVRVYTDITETTLVASYITIHSAIDDASTLAGHVVRVDAGTYAENVNVTKGVTLLGANANTACGSRVGESIIAPTSGLPVNVAADGVTLNGFEITAPSNRNGIQGGTWSDLNVLFNNIHHINSSASPMLMVTHAVEYTVPSGGVSNVTVSDNCIHDIGSSSLTGNSASAIGVLGSNSLGTLTGLNIERNSIDDVTVSNGNWPTGKIAYGIMINTGGNGSYMTNGKVTGAQVNDNEIDGLTGHIATGVALEGNTENAVVSGNIISTLSSTKNADLANGGYEANALKFENNRYVSTCTVEDNAFLVGTFNTAGGSGTGYGVANYVPTANGGTADVSCNWFDTPSYDVIVQDDINGRVLDKAGCATDFTAWRTDGTDGNSAIGFQPVGPCDGTPVVATLDVATPVNCNGGSDGAILVDISGGTYEDISPADGSDDDNDVTYSWTGVSPVLPEFATTQDVSGLSAGTYRLVVTDGNGSTDTLDVVITEPVILSAGTTQVDVLCFGNTTGSIDLTVGGGTTPYTYLWSPGNETTEDLSGLAAGAYSVLVTDANGCTTTANVTITQPGAALSAGTTQVDVLCFGNTTGSIDLTVGGGTTPYTYLWSPGNETTEDLSGLAAGAYSVLVTDANGCTTTANVTITQPGAALSAGTTQVDVLCFGNTTGSIDLTVGGGTTPYTYLWSPGNETTEDLSGLAAGAYSVLVTDANGCTTTANVTITQPGAALSAGTTQVDVLCFGNTTGSIDLTVGGGTTPYSYLWSPGNETTEDLSGLAAGAYSVLVTDANGCTTTANVTITQPGAALSAGTTQVDVLCFGNTTGSIDLTVGGGTTPYTYLWSPGNETTEDLSGLAAGAYSVLVTDANGCTTTANVTITQPGAALSAGTTQVDVLCFGNTTGSIDLTVGGGTTPYSYLWSPGNETTEDLSNLAAGTYSVVVTDANGCTTSAIVTITQPGAALGASTTQVDVLCFGNSTGSIDLTVGGGTTPYSYLWSPGNETTEDLSGLAAGAYSVLVTDASGCTTTANVTITQPGAALSAGTTQVDVLCFGNTTGSIDLTVGGGTTPYTYLWSPGNETTEDLSGLAAGAYSVLVTDANGCTTTANVTITQPGAALGATGPLAPNSPILCFGGTTTVTMNISGGTAPYSVNGNPPGAFDQTITVFAGVTNLNVVDANGCTTSTTTQNISEPTPVVLTGSYPPIPCFGGTTNVTLNVTGGTPGYVYFGGNPPTANVSAGSYTYYVKDDNDCPAQTTVVVVAPDTLDAYVSAPAAVCYGSNAYVAFAGPVNGTVHYNGDYTGSAVLGGNGLDTLSLVGLTSDVTVNIVSVDSASCSNPYSGSVTIIVNPLPVMTCTADFAVCVDAASFALTGSTPLGGTYSGAGVSGGNFDAATAGVGAHTITYSYTDGNGCSNSCTFTITVNPLPVMSCPTDFAVCVSAPSFALTGSSPAGGTYSGPGVSGGNFDAALAGVGAHTITYSYTDVNSCTNTCTFTITVNALPVVACTTDFAVCVSAPSFALTGSSPAGGTYSGPGVSGGNFDAALAGVGAHTITYSYTDVNSCTNTCTFTITVNALPVMTCTADFAVCVDAASFALTGSTPLGGTYSGAGVSGGNFDAATAGVGAHTITYSYTDGNGCSNSCTFTITVNALPVMTCTADFAVCVDAASFALTGSTPLGGTYSGAGVSGGNFDAATAGVGAHTITYSYTDGNGCSNSCTFTITVNPLPVMTCTADFAVCVDAASFALTGSSPAGGTYSGPGVSGGNFDAATAGVGAHTITYSYTDGNGCSNSCTFTITVNALPVMTCTADFAVCVDAASFALTGSSPAGGTYSGPGVSGGNFDAATAGVGAHTITYSYTDGNGCSNSCTFTITVNALPVMTCTADFAVCVDAASFALTGSSPAGGTYSGPGVSGGNFDAATAGVGAHTITYSYTDGNGCSNSCTFTITVNALPVMTCTADFAVCVDAASFALTGSTPLGGTYSGAGVSGGNFDAATAGVGAHTITYSYTDGNGCSNSCTFTITVNPLPVMTCTADFAVCVDAASFALTGSSPAGGTYSGPGVSGGNFDAATAGVGAHTITYSYTDGNGCSNSCTFTITVNALPVMTCTADFAVCVDAASFALTGSSPAGGTYSGPGVSGGNFDAATAGVGAHTITYSYTDGNGCSNSCTFTITVNALPVMTCTADFAVCVDAASFALTGSSPAGGTYSGPGVSGGNFDAATAGVGAHTITYSYTDGNGCSNSCTFTITVNALPVMTCTADFAVCVDATSFALTGSSPAGGTYSGPGVSGGNFDAATAGVGAHTITYSYTDGNGCSNTCTFTITVNALPVVTAGSYGPVCVDAADITLVGSPSGGTWSGTGVTGDQFDPSAGTQTVTYIYTDGNGCSNSDVTTITVDDLATVAAAGMDQLQCDNTTFTMAGNTPGVGTGMWTIQSGPGSITNPADPGTTVTGVTSGSTTVLRWTITNGQCSNYDEVSLVSTGVGVACDDGNPNTLNDVYTMSCVCVGTDFVDVALVAMLEGPFVELDDRMNDKLRDGVLPVVYPLIPSAQPYNVAPYNYAGSETVAPAVLAVTDFDDAIVDWVLVEIRSSIIPALVLHTRAALIQRDGDIVDTDGVSPVRFLNVPLDNYYLAVRHRNHLGIMTAAGYPLSGTPSTIDLTLSSTLTYGTDARKAVGGRMVMWQGNTKGLLGTDRLRYTGTNNDRDAILLKIGGMVPTLTWNGYTVEDGTMNGQVKYTGAGNDRDPILVNVNGVPTNQRFEQLP